MARLGIIGATRGWICSTDRSNERGGEESAFRNSSEREKIARSIIIGLLVLTKLLLLGRRDSDRVKVSSLGCSRAHVSSDFLGCYASRLRGSTALPGKVVGKSARGATMIGEKIDLPSTAQKLLARSSA